VCDFSRGWGPSGDIVAQVPSQEGGVSSAVKGASRRGTEPLTFGRTATVRGVGRKGRTGSSLGGAETSPERRKRDAAKRRREEKRWAKRSGPVTVRFVDPEDLKRGGQPRPVDAAAEEARPAP
jgi:hypothetical protein